MGSNIYENEKNVKTKGVYLSKATIVAFVVLFLGSIVTVGLLAGLLPNQGCDQDSGNSPSKGDGGDGDVTVSPTTDVPKEIWEQTRLPETLLPEHYDLQLEVDLEKFVFTGSVTITITCKEATNQILLHSKALTIEPKSISVTDENDELSDPEVIGDPEFFPDLQYVLLNLDIYLEVGEKYYLTIDEFAGELLDDLVGFYRSSYQADDGNQRWLAVSFFAPTDARKAFPCFDEPALKATFNITLIHSSEYHGLSNMPVLNTNSAGAGSVETTFEKSVPMSTYLVTFLVSDYVNKSDFTQNQVEMKVWSRNNAIDSVDYALSVGVRVLDYFDDYFNISFPLPKMGMAAIPDFAAGAMENWGLVDYREVSLLYDPLISTTSNKQRVATIVAHELAHQWFGNLVTPEWWDLIWLNEGFASYVEYLGADFVEPDWSMNDQFLILDLHPVLALDSLVTSHPISLPVNHPDEINEIFDAISYNKGSSIIRMMQYFLGESTFRKGLTNYLNAFAYGNSVQDDLWIYLSMAAEEDGKEVDVKAIMETWTLQMGYPVVNINRDYSNEEDMAFTTTQEYFLLDPYANISTEYTNLGYVWWVPLTVTDGVAKMFTNPTQFWLKNSSESETFSNPSLVGGSNDWLLANVNQTGYFRVNYDTKNWQMLIDTLLTDHQAIPDASRSALIDDSFNLAQAERLNQTMALNLSLYLIEEREYVPWYTASSAFNYIKLMLSRTRAYGALKGYMIQQVMPLYEEIGWVEQGSSHLENLTRIVALDTACTYGLENCTVDAVEQFSRWMLEPENNMISVNLKSVVYCTAIGSGSQEEWEFAWEQYLSSQVASEKSILMGSLACSGEPWILSRYLDYTLDSSFIRSSDAINVIVVVANNPVGQPLAWDFFRDKWDHFREVYGSQIFQFADLIEGVTKPLSTELELKELEDFIVTHPDAGTGERALEQAVEQTKANIRWKNNHLQEVQDWFESNTR